MFAWCIPGCLAIKQGTLGCAKEMIKRAREREYRVILGSWENNNYLIYVTWITCQVFNHKVTISLLLTFTRLHTITFVLIGQYLENNE